MKFTAALLSTAALVAPVSAQADQAAFDAVTTVVTQAAEAFNAGDLSAIMAARSPGQLQVLADAAGTSVDQMLQAHAAKVTASLDIVDIAYFGLLPDRMEMKQTPSGRSFVQGFTEEYWRMDELNLHRVIGAFVAFEEDGQWYITQTRKPRDLISLRKAHPDFLGAEFADGRMERVWDNVLPDHLRKAD
ncbi:MAG: hypothetical protein AB8B82_05660 [Roseovarius sp.]